MIVSAGVDSFALLALQQFKQKETARHFNGRQTFLRFEYIVWKGWAHGRLKNSVERCG